MHKYPNEKLYDITRENYRLLTHYCYILEDEGYWQHPETVLKRHIHEFVALYVQAMMVQLAVYIHACDKETVCMIAHLDVANPLKINVDHGITKENEIEAKRMMLAPPILLQLCSLRDVEKHSSMTGLFFDALLNILFSMTYLNNRTDAAMTRYIREYYGRIQAFVQNANTRGACVDEKYIFRKICMGELESNTEQLKRAGDDFVKYKKEALFIEERKPKDTVKESKPESIPPADTVYSKEDISLENEDWNIENSELKIQEEESLEPKSWWDLPEEEDDIEGSIILEESFQEGENNFTELDKKTDNIENDIVQEKSPNSENDFIQQKFYNTENNQKNLDNKDNTVSEDNNYLESNKDNSKEADGADSSILKEDKSTENDIKETNDAVRDRMLEKLVGQLEELVGLNDVKTEIHSLINLIRVRKMREAYHLPGMPMSYHMVFTGNPGTGKTTVARLIGEIYQELGVLSKGTITEIDRAGLVAGYVGQTAIKVKEVVDKAKGGILFIDEAYTLSNAVGGNDFGTEAIDTLVKLMEDYRDDLVVIVAGYTYEMEQFLKSNTGLVSRFNKFVEFPDYSDKELLLILDRMADKSGFMLAEGVERIVEEYLLTMKEAEKEKFGNARGIRNLFEKMVSAQANRVVGYGMPTKKQLSEILPEDLSFIQ